MTLGRGRSHVPIGRCPNTGLYHTAPGTICAHDLGCHALTPSNLPIYNCQTGTAECGAGNMLAHARVWRRGSCVPRTCPRAAAVMNASSPTQQTSRQGVRVYACTLWPIVGRLGGCRGIRAPLAYICLRTPFGLKPGVR